MLGEKKHLQRRTEQKASCKMPPGTALAAVVNKNGELRPVDGDLLLEADDEVVAITPPDKEDQLWKALTGGP